MKLIHREREGARDSLSIDDVRINSFNVINIIRTRLGNRGRPSLSHYFRMNVIDASEFHLLESIFLFTFSGEAAKRDQPECKPLNKNGEKVLRFNCTYPPASEIRQPLCKLIYAAYNIGIIFMWERTKNKIKSKPK